MEFKSPVLRMKLIKYYSDFCPPCKLMQPIVESVVKELNIELMSINVGVEPPPVGITSVPTFVLLGSNGKILDEKVGMISKPAFLEWIKSFNGM